MANGWNSIAILALIDWIRRFQTIPCLIPANVNAAVDLLTI
jgi:hypothetical protein